MSASNMSTEKAGKKRKHEGDGAASPTKKSKSAQRSERRRLEDANRNEQTAADFAAQRASVKEAKREHREGLSKEEKKEKRKQRKKEKAADALMVREDDQTVAKPEDAIDYRSSAGQRERKTKKEVKKDGGVMTQQQDRKHKKSRKKGAAAEQSVVKPKAKWMTTDASAGRFIDHDPVFVRDVNGQSYLLAAVGSQLQVLSIETSLLVRTLSAPNSARVCSFAVESPDSNMVHVGCSNESVVVWDWTNDLPALPLVTSTAGDLESFTAVRLSDDDEYAALFYVCYFQASYAIFAQDQPLYRTKQSLETLLVLDHANFIVARGADTMVVGKKNADDQYAFVELPLSTSSTCMDARVVQAPPGSKKSKAQSGLQLAIGNVDGQIHLYDNIAILFSPGGQQSLPAPRILHWHRQAASSVKFSRDGNYLISGGKETVLVLWQLETGRKQFLPHLTSEIERIVVSPQGDRYALQMGDNSIMVLSTSELKPVANFAGLQMPAVVSNTTEENVQVPAAALHPKHPKQLLMSVPSTQPKENETAPRPFLQTFDLRTARHINRQALTRNNVTDLAIGPEDNVILPPDVAHLAISKDGQWLATVDEWMPPASDVEHLASDSSGTQEAREKRREVYLKIWLWDESQKLWTLSTRTDSPHARADGQSMGAGRVLALVSDPASNTFATTGEDGNVKIWKPRTRVRHGVAVTDGSNQELVEWTCRRRIQLPTKHNRADSPLDTFDTSPPSTACLSYSSDGSLLAVSRSSDTVTFIDTATGAIKPTKRAFSDGSTITSMAFLQRYFITVTRSTAYIRDLVSDGLMYKQKLGTSAGEAGAPLLAVNEVGQTFVVAVRTGQGTGMSVEVYEARQTARLYRQEFDAGISKILPNTGGRGYVVIFADATIRTITPSGIMDNTALAKLEAKRPVEEQLALEATDAMDIDEEEETTSFLPTTKDGRVEASAAVDDEGDRAVVQPEQLAKVFDVGQSFALPPVRDMFQSVVELFGKRPAGAVAGAA